MSGPAGGTLQAALEAERPLQVPGVVNAYAALLAKSVGFRAVYLSGAGVANASFGLPDLAMTTLTEVAEEARRIASVCDLPLLVDADTGFGSAFNIARTARELGRAGAAGMHIEDQAQAKRCGHRPNKSIVSTHEMCDRLKAAVDARPWDTFVVMARTDAFANEGLQRAVERAAAYIEAGADMIFVEALTALEQYRDFCAAVEVPVLANLTEFGRTPSLELDALGAAGVSLVLYPLSAFRAMSRAALDTYAAIRRDGTPAAVLDRMQTREELYDVLGYHDYEDRLDRLFAEKEDQ